MQSGDGTSYSISGESDVECLILYEISGLNGLAGLRFASGVPSVAGSVMSQVVWPGSNSIAIYSSFQDTANDVTFNSGQSAIISTQNPTYGSGVNHRGASAVIASGGGASILSTCTGLNYPAYSIAFLSGSGGGSSVIPGGAWTKLTFGGSTVSKFGFSVYASTQTFSLAAGQRLEVQGYVYRTTPGTTSAQVFVSADGTTSYYMANQTDGNAVLYYYSGGSHSIQASGGNSVNIYTGYTNVNITVNPTSTSNSWLTGVVDQYNTGPHQDGSIDMVGTVTVYVTSDTIASCDICARIVS